MEASLNVRTGNTAGFDARRAANDVEPLTSYEGVAEQLREAMSRTQGWLLDQQHPDGHWVAELEGDTILESEYLCVLAYLGRHRTPVARKAAQYILSRQLPCGGWTLYPGGRMDISGSVKAYFSLKMTGHDPEAEYMQRARKAILANGGADAVNSFTRFYLALLGQISYDECPAVPPEVMLLPRWFPINLYSVSAWTRTMLVPLSVMSACQPVAKLDPELGIRELFLNGPENLPPVRCPGLKGGTGLFSWDRFFRLTDKAMHFCQRWNLLPRRKKALEAAKQWMLERFHGSDGLGAIFPPMIWSIVALRCLGYTDDSPELKYCYERLDGLLIEEGDMIRLQPCKSPVWDTSITLRALAASGLSAQHEAFTSGIRWLLDRQIRQEGDWAKTTRAEPGGWCFEYANSHYPDLDDTAMVLMALEEQFASLPTSTSGVASTRFASQKASSRDDASPTLEETTAAIERGSQWVVAMQNRDGGWGAFDRDNDREFLCYVPFADHNAMIDPSTPDLSARVLESLGQLGHRVGQPAVDRAVAYLRRTQESDGAWFGRWGVNYIYGTWQVLNGMAAVGVPGDDPAMQAGARWLLIYQQENGGWGESPDSYADPSLRGQGVVTASQTAWAVSGLVAAGLHDHPAVLRGIRYLIETQRDDGTWDEPEYTGTGFPQVFYLRYHWYPIYFPLMALAQWSKAMGTSGRVDLPSLNATAAA
ncbi:MAG TPA: terpene cyclase/mutase family protein [Pirellulales bacterium]|nr:terpene cyclase/mutase family protein [Pirellulales bacterium]